MNNLDRSMKVMAEQEREIGRLRAENERLLGMCRRAVIALAAAATSMPEEFDADYEALSAAIEKHVAE